jgi:cytochrome c oxidase cbb3-type subunit 4
MDLATLRELGTLFLLLAFLGLCAWAYLPANEQRFAEDALLPFRDDGGDPPAERRPR